MLFKARSGVSNNWGPSSNSQTHISHRSFKGGWALSTRSLSSLSLPPVAAVLPVTKNVSRALIPI